MVIPKAISKRCSMQDTSECPAVVCPSAWEYRPSEPDEPGAGPVDRASGTAPFALPGPLPRGGRPPGIPSVVHLGDSANALEDVRPAPQHQPLQRPDLLQIAVSRRPKDALSQVLHRPVD